MKKLLAIILTALLALSLTAPALAYVDEVDYMSVAFDIQKQTVPFKADGVINDGEYFKVDVKDTWISLSCASPDGDQVCLDTETPLYMSWDENNVYIAAYYKVEGDNYYCVNSSLWDQCCIQTAFCAVDNTGTDTLEMGFGRNSDDGSLFFTRWYDWLASGYEAEEGVNCKITYEDSILLYEISVPWEGINDEAGKAGNQFMFNFIWGMGNEAIGYIAKQLSSGVSGSKDATRFATVTLVEGAVEAAPSYTYPASGEAGSIIKGDLVGNEAGWGDNADAGRAAAFDGNPATFFDPLGVGDGYCGIDAGEAYILEKAAILSRADWAARFLGAMIQGSNDGETWTTLWTSPAEAASTTDYTVITEFENNTGYRYFRYFNETNHGDVAEVEFYGAPGTAAAEAPVETPVETPATTAPVTTAPQTGDILVIAAIALVASLGTAVVAKKH